MRKVFILMFTLLATLTAGCSTKADPISRSAFLLNTYVTITLYDSEDTALLDQCMKQCSYYENLFSRTKEGSLVYRMNHRMPGEDIFLLDEDTEALIRKGLEYSKLSKGAFDITVEPIISLWNFAAEKPVLPDPAELEMAVQQVGYENLELEGSQLRFLSPNTRLDLGAIAKGYIADRLKEYLKSQGVESAIINLGGNVLCLGEKPDGTPFKIGLQKPYADRNETIATLQIRDASVVSSGVYERHFVLDGTNYHHILNPSDGYPYENGLTGVTIVSSASVDGDGLSTTCFSLGLQEGIRLLDSLEGVWGYFITDDGTVHYSQGARELLE